jgi:hypothetical protein
MNKQNKVIHVVCVWLTSHQHLCCNKQNKVIHVVCVWLTSHLHLCYSKQNKVMHVLCVWLTSHQHLCYSKQNKVILKSFIGNAVYFALTKFNFEFLFCHWSMLLCCQPMILFDVQKSIQCMYYFLIF